ncbi:hypothetical protein [Actinotalea sp. C106]|uniref:hypothetical protein n=1 Tax=Actinotalea sp. C106 TaxID=2908644 RepID=UPI002027AADD|nr:hypothetical protein [Actinotalea sp. C106]
MPDAKFLREDALAWRVLYCISRPSKKKSWPAHDARGRSREQIATDIVNDGLGPDASVWGRHYAVEALTNAILVACAAAYFPLLGVALLVRPFFGALATGNALALVLAALFPVLGLVVPMSVRLARAVRQLRAWEGRGEPEDERPVDGSLPGVPDLAIGMSLGAVLSAMIVIGVVVG